MKKVYLNSIFICLLFLLPFKSIAQYPFSWTATRSTYQATVTASAISNATVTFYIWGAGGGGSSPTSSASGGSGASGGYIKATVTVPQGQSRTFSISVGAGGAGRASSASLSGGEGGSTIVSGSGGTFSLTAHGGSGATTTTGGNNSGKSNTLSGSGYTSVSNFVGNNGAFNSNNNGAAGGAPRLNGAPASGAINYTIPSAGAGGSQNNSATSGTNGGGGGAGGRATGQSITSGGNGGDGYVYMELSGNGATLPVTFGAIKASEKGTGVQIDWTSFSESNIANYQIERSADGIHFTSVGEVAPRNVAEATNYYFFDALPLSGTSFYRIRNNDIDGKSGLSNIVKINLNKIIKTIGVYPNPVLGNRVSFQTSDLAKGTYNVEVINAMGSRVFQQSVNHAGGAINQSLSLPILQSGQYTLRINGTSSSSIHKITILQ